MNKRKIINDPIYGLISFPFEILYDIIDHKYFQRLRRISQMGLSSYVYPGANHSRFSHALGALHLMTTAIATLRKKSIQISDAEYQAVCLAILLHDIGHCPFSHGLEQVIYDKHHEHISLDLMEALNLEFDGELSLAIQIFKGDYNRPFLTQLVSSQLDMDRMDYLTRDSYYSGVAEGVIGYNRLISMMNVVDEQLVIEEKAIFSIEKFLVARHFMYWQVYLHKTSIVAERLLKEYMHRLIELIKGENLGDVPDSALVSFIRKRLNGTINDNNYLETFTELDDIDVLASIKAFKNHPDQILSYLATSILKRQLFKLILQNSPISGDFINEIRQKAVKQLHFPSEMVSGLIFKGEESTQAYNNYKEDIKVLMKDSQVKPLAELLNSWINVKKVTKYYLCYPKIIE